MASLYRWASIAVSPRCSSLLKERCLKSERKRYVRDGVKCARDVMPLTRSPIRVITLLANLSSQFTRHLVETLDRIRYAVRHFETFTNDLVDRGPGKCELRTNSVSIPRQVREQKKVLALTAESKTSFHKSRVNFAFAHSLRSGVGIGESPSLPRAERRRWVKSDQKR